MTESAVSISGLGKMYKLYRRPAYKVLDAFGVSSLLFWRRHVHQPFWALRDLDLVVKRGERLGIIGRNGAGKSTLLKIISGNVAPTEGTVRVQGRVQALMELGTGFHPEFTGRQNIRASLAYNGFSSARIRAKEEDIIEFAELDSFIDQPVKTYSAGMYARLGFSTATAIEPDLLIIDEVLGAGDAYFAGKCVDRMKQLTKASGATILFVSHDLGSVQHMCERVIWLDRGRIVQDGDPLTIIKAYYASILQQEEARLKARNARLARGQASQIVADEQDDRDVDVLLRLTTEHGRAPKARHPVRRITLTIGPDWRQSIEPGSPMDNDQATPARLLTDAMYMNWSEPTVIGGARVRCFQNVGGRYLHAPLVFTVPTAVLAQSPAQLEIEHDADPAEPVLVDVYSGERYQTIGRLTGEPRAPRGWRRQTLTIPVPSATAARGPDGSPGAPGAPGTSAGESSSQQAPSDAATQRPVRRRQSTDRFTTEFAAFAAIETTGPGGAAQVVFGGGEPIGLRVAVDVRRAIDPCIFVIAVYSPGGVVLLSMQWPIEGGLQPGRAQWHLNFTEPNLRQGEYVLSAALIREWPRVSNEWVTYYCEWNRNVSFRVEEGLIGAMPIGLVRVTCDPPEGSALVVQSATTEAVAG